MGCSRAQLCHVPGHELVEGGMRRRPTVRSISIFSRRTEIRLSTPSVLQP